MLSKVCSMHPLTSNKIINHKLINITTDTLSIAKIRVWVTKHHCVCTFKQTLLLLLLLLLLVFFSVEKSSSQSKVVALKTNPYGAERSRRMQWTAMAAIPYTVLWRMRGERWRNTSWSSKWTRHTKASATKNGHGSYPPREGENISHQMGEPENHYFQMCLQKGDMLVFRECTFYAGGGRGTRFHEAHHSQSFSKSAQEFAR